MSDVILMFKTSRYYDNIKPVQVVKETAKFITYLEDDWGRPSERKQAKDGDAKFHATWEEARTHLIERCEREIESLRIRLNATKGKLGSIKGMRPPTELATSNKESEAAK